jgi:hypothetical protein
MALLTELVAIFFAASYKDPAPLEPSPIILSRSFAACPTTPAHCASLRPIRSFARLSCQHAAIRPLVDMSEALETISSLQVPPVRGRENVGTWKPNKKIELKHRLSAQHGAEEKIQQRICWLISLAIPEECSNSCGSRLGRFCRSSER